MRTQITAFAALLHLLIPLGCGSGIDGSAPADETEVAPSPEVSDVGDVSQALGAFTYKFTTTATLNPLHLGSTSAVFAGTGCVNEVLFVNRTTGSQWHAGFESCRRPLAAVSDSVVFIGDGENNDILRYGTEGFAGWVKLADTQGDPRGRMLLTSSHVYWSDDAGIRRVPRGGGAPSIILPTADHPFLEALDGSTIYYSVRTANGGQNLRRMPVGGGGSVNLYTAPHDLGQVFVDATHVYFVEQDDPFLGVPPPTDSRILRQSKTSLDVESIWDHDDGRYYQYPITRQGALYWLEIRNLDPITLSGDAFMRRMTVGNYNTVVTRDYGSAAYIRHMGVFSDGVYTASRDAINGVATAYVRRGDL